MKINAIKISGYRQLQDITINFEDSITIVGGPNNSGKTSLIELFKWVFGKNLATLQSDDFPITSSQNWCNLFFPIVDSTFQSVSEKDACINHMCESIFPLNPEQTPIQLGSIQVFIEVTYSPKDDDIRLFSKYLMELDENDTIFNFLYTFTLKESLFHENLSNEFQKLEMRYKDLNRKNFPNGKRQNLEHVLKDMLLSIYTKSCTNEAYFTDKTYTNKIKLEITDFKKLFNYENIMASRNLDDESNQKLHTLSNDFINTASTDPDWADMMLRLPDEILKPIQKSEIKSLVNKTSIQALKHTLQSISKTNGSNPADIIIDLDISENSIKSLLGQSIHAKYQFDSSYLDEASQGLGYSNLIFLHLQLEKFYRTINPTQVNLFIIEEPEAHMHPQMQQVFTNYIFAYFADKKQMQGFITTHSSAVIKNSKVQNIRVLRQTEHFSSELYNLRSFYESQELNQDHKDFYDRFYNIAFPDIVFADKIILYEGDTERMLLSQAIHDIKVFSILKQQYLSFIQVGGAYAFKYIPLLKFLKIKSAIITDLDYDKEKTIISDVLTSNTTNATILNFAKEIKSVSNPTIKQLYEWKNSQIPVQWDELIALAYPGEKDGYARTLEEAMFSKKYKINVCDSRLEAEWKQLKKDDGLSFTVPRANSSNVRTVVEHSSANKTDFMYSVIMQQQVENMFPEYIKEVLIWLNN